MGLIQGIRNFCRGRDPAVGPNSPKEQVARGVAVATTTLAAITTLVVVGVVLVTGFAHGCHCLGPWNHLSNWMHHGVGHTQNWVVLTTCVGAPFVVSTVALCVFSGRDERRSDRVNGLLGQGVHSVVEGYETHSIDPETKTTTDRVAAAQEFIIQSVLDKSYLGNPAELPKNIRDEIARRQVNTQS